ncbi:MAG: sugar transferase [Clostridia bacterium]|nr:sugar transferase [Clostridia bacterium]
MEELLNSPWGIACILAFDFFAILMVVCLTYRWFFKRVFDVLVSAVCLAVTSPIFLAIVIRGKKFQKENEGVIESLMKTDARLSRKEKVVFLHTYRTKDADGQVLGRYGRWLESTKLYKLPLLLDVFFGRLSFIGGKGLLPSEGKFIESEVEKDRFLVRAGLINPLVCVGDKETTFEEMFLSDRKYAWQFGFFMDCKIFFAWLLNVIRGNGDYYMGETREISYAKYLLENEKITQADYDASCELDKIEE